jgi:N6-adenosine-specific RNA methylase IME4
VEQYSDRLHLADVGIDRKLSSRAQKLGGIAERTFEAMIGRMREQITECGSRVALGALSTEEKKERRAAREKLLADAILALPTEKSGVIVSDDEWDHQVWSRDTGMGRHAANHYETASDSHTAQELHERTKGRFECAADNCFLAMWATVQHLDIAIDLLRLRGFRYVSHYVWGKDKVGLGRWNRNKHELLLLGVKGNVPCPAPGTQSDSLIMAPRREHSAKPECFLEMIQQYFPNMPKIELNRRGPVRPGWAAWGNEALPNDELQHEIAQATNIEDENIQAAQKAAPQSLEDDPFHIPDFCLHGHPDCVIGR